MNHNGSSAAAAASRRQIVLILTALAVVAAAGGVYFFLRPASPSQIAHVFSGTIERVEGSTIVARGTFLADGVDVKRNQEAVGDEVRITITSSTVLTRVSWQLPELGSATGTMTWNMADLKQDRGQGSLAELAGMENVPFSAVSEGNILYQSQFQAKTLEYLTTSFYKPKDKIPQ